MPSPFSGDHFSINYFYQTYPPGIIFCHRPLNSLSAWTNDSASRHGAPRPNQKHQHISKLKLTDGYRKRLSESRAVNQNVRNFPDLSVQLFSSLASSPLKYYLDGRILNRLYKSNRNPNKQNQTKHGDRRLKNTMVYQRDIDLPIS